MTRAEAAVEICSLAQRPDLVERMGEVDGAWPAFMLNDPVAAYRYDRAAELVPELLLLALDGERIIARVHAVPIRWPGAQNLPDRGWDWALESAVDHPTDDRSAVSLIEARITPERRGRGLPADHWLRVHVRLGGRIVKVAPLSMTIPGTLAQWRQWTGLPLDVDGLVVVPGALTPVLVDTGAGHAAYVEPNVWVHHRLA